MKTITKKQLMCIYISFFLTTTTRIFEIYEGEEIKLKKNKIKVKF